MDTKVIQKQNNILNEQEVKEFKQLMKETYGIEISDEEALEQGSRLVIMFELICKLNTKEDSIMSKEKMLQNE